MENNCQNFFKRIIDVTETTIKSFSLNSRTGPTIRSNNQSSTLAYNLFLENIEGITNDLSKSIDRILTEIKGEIIRLQGSGSIIDLGNPAFQIISSITWDIYFYEPENFAYIRLLHELDNEKEWISLDIDFVSNSAWFQDEKEITQRDSYG